MNARDLLNSRLMYTINMLQPSLFPGDEPSPVPESLGQARIELRPNSRALSKPHGLGDFDFTLNPYIGCGFGCAYCFAAAFVADEDKRAQWGTWVDVKIDAEKQIAKADTKGKKIFMSSATDPYQPLEGKIGLTRRIVELLSDPIRQPYLVVQTRSPLVTRDIDLLKRFDRVRVNMSITTDSESVRKRFEPACASIDRRIEALKEVSMAGIDTAVCISPMLPIEDPEAFAKRLAAINPTHVFAAYFHKSDKPFVSNTRPPALEAAQEYGWTEETFRRTRLALSQHLTQLGPWKN